MSARRFLALLAPGMVPGDHFELDPEESLHATRVLRLKAGQRIQVFDGQGAEYVADLVRVTPRGCQCVLVSETAAVAEPAIPVSLAFGLSKKNATDLIIQKAVELGVDALYPFFCEHSVVAPGTPAKESARLERWTKMIRDATKQCGRATLCQIHPPTPLSQYVAQAQGPESISILCWEKAPSKDTLSAVLTERVKQKPTSIRLAIGPEGGLTDDEGKDFHSADYAVASLGPRILRAETAALAAVTITLASLGEM